MGAGKYNLRFTLQSRSATETKYSTETVTWTEVSGVWGNLVPLRPGIRYDASIVEDVEPTHRIEVRHRTDITPRGNRFVLGSRNFEVFGVERDERGIELHLAVVERT